MSNIIRGISLNNINPETIQIIDNTINNTSYSNESFSNVLTQTIRNSQDIARNVPIGRISTISINSSTYNNQNINNNTVLENNFSTIEQNNNIPEDFPVEIKAKYSDTKNRIANAVKNASSKYNVDPNLILAVIQTESNFNPKATSKAGAVGLMQLMPSNFKHLGVSNGYNIEENIDGGTKLLKEYIDKYNGDIEMALMAYNGGPTRMANRGVKSPNDLYKMPKETQNYVPKVMNIYRGS